MIDRIQGITDKWFLNERLLFSTVISHRFVENRAMRCALRSGQGRIEFNPSFLEELSDNQLDIALRTEALRILLKHPYQRQPLQAIPEIMSLASNITIFEHAFYGDNPLDRLEWLSLPPKLSFEEYYNMLTQQIPPASSGNSESSESSENSENSDNHDNPDNSENSDNSHNSDNSDSSHGLPNEMREELKEEAELWEEDLWMEDKMNDLIQQAMTSRQWGSVPASMQDLLKASIEKNLNVLRQIGLFRASILSTQRRLTRMKPSRRYGWQQMGIVHPYTTRLLVAVDTSGSVPDDDLKRFFSIVNKFFSYGIPQIDILQFDADIHLPLLSLKNAAKQVKITGRGGTNFQPALDYFANHREYDGMLIFTDGYAPTPHVPPGRRILWVLSSLECYKDFTLSPKIYI